MNKDLLIVAQNSATGAASIVAAAVSAGKTEAEEILPLFDAIRTHIFQGTVELGGATPVAPTPVAEAVAEPASAPANVTPVPTPVATPQAAPAADSDAGSIAFKFGKHQGKTIAQVAQEDGKYLEWAATNLTNNQFMNDKIRAYLASVA